MEVQRAAALVLGHLHVRRAHTSSRTASDSVRRASSRGIWIRRPPPQLRRERVPQHRVLVVEALRADRLAEPRIVLVVDLVARDRRRHAGTTSPFAPRPAPPRLAVDHAARMHRPEARRRQRQEHHRMLRHRLGHALAAAHARGDELERVTAIRLARTTGRPPRAGCRSTSAASRPAHARSRTPSATSPVATSIESIPPRSRTGRRQ